MGDEEEGAPNDLVTGMIQTETTLDEKMEKSELRLFSQSQPITSAEHREGVNYEAVQDNGRVRRKALFDDDDDNDEDESDDGEEEEEDEEGESSEEGESDVESEAESKGKLKRKTEAPVN